ncbi:MAG TPA: hypothetical protein VEI54_09990, partial [Candidatus Limnocylindrales bacterium]|nr:hypothetical protein [Candidatus Limnocylindrales bacterium]
QAQPQLSHKVITFSVPGAGTGANQGTYVDRIVDSGAVTGWYIDSNNVYHGFIRTPDGVITKVDAPGALNAPGLGTIPEGMNWEGVTTGYYTDSNGVYHAYLRSPDGAFANVDVPTAGTGQGQGTIPCSINARGTVLGVFIDANNNGHYFLRSLFGRFTTFDAPDEGAGVMGLSTGELQDALSDAGAAIGMFVDLNFVMHGWLRTPDGKITRIDAPGAGTGAWEGTYAVAVNEKGTVSGGFVPQGKSWGNIQGFVRDVHGTITTFAPPQGWGSVQSNTMNAWGEIAGTCWTWDENNESVAAYADHAFSRAPNGTYTVFRLPGAGTGNFQGTYAMDINDRGWIAGTVTDDNSVTWSYIMIP